MKRLHSLNKGDYFWFDEQPIFSVYKVISQKKFSTFCETPSGNKQYYLSSSSVIKCNPCYSCQGGGCDICVGYGFINE